MPWPMKGNSAKPKGVPPPEASPTNRKARVNFYCSEHFRALASSSAYLLSVFLPASCARDYELT